MNRIALPDPAGELLESDAVAHVVTLNEDGSPHVTAAWVGLEAWPRSGSYEEAATFQR